MADEPTLSRRPSDAAKKWSQRRHIVNRRLLAISCVSLAVLLPAVYFWYFYQVQRTAAGLLERAELLKEKQDWNQAAGYYQRYLLLKPEETSTLVTLVETLAELEPNPERLRRLNRLLYRAIGRVDAEATVAKIEERETKTEVRDRLRIQLAENLFHLGDFDEMDLVLKATLEPSPEFLRVANKLAALSLAGRARVDSGISVEDVARALISAANEAPGDSELIEETAYFLRSNPTLELAPIDSSLAGTEPAALANQLMDRMVDAAPQSFESRLARYRYRVRFGLSGVDEDRAAVVEIAPDRVDAILLQALADTDASGNRLEQVEPLLRRAMEIAPNDPRPYVVLAGLVEQAGNRNEAVKLLQTGYENSGGNPEIGFALANALLRAEQIDEAERIEQDLEQQGLQVLANLDRAARRRWEIQLALLKARRKVARGVPHEAIADVRSALRSLEADPESKGSPEATEVRRTLAETYVRIGQWDRASEYWGQVAAARPDDAVAVQAAAAAHLRAENPRAAIELIDRFAASNSLTDELLVQKVQAQLLYQTSRPFSRDWKQFRTAVAAAKSQVGNRPEIVIAEVNQLNSEANFLQAAAPESHDSAQQNADAVTLRQQAAQQLRDSETEFLQDVEFWRNAALLYQALAPEANEDDVQRALARHRELSASTLDQAELEATVRLAAGDYAAAEAVLREIEPSLTKEDSERAARLQISILTSANRTIEALEQLKKLVDLHPGSADLLRLGVDLALQAEDFQTTKVFEEQLREVVGDVPDVRYRQARRLLATYDRISEAEKKELAESLTALRDERPQWYPVIALAGRLAQLQGHADQALADYEQAVTLGDRRAFTLLQYVQLLVQYDRLDDARRVMRYFSRVTANRPPDPDLSALVVELSARVDGSGEALRMARQAVEQSPGEALPRITLATLLSSSGQAAEAVNILKDAAGKFPGDRRVWTALITALVQTNRANDARELLAALATHPALPEVQRHILAARGYEILGDTQRARSEYERALAERSQDTAVRLAYAKVLAISDPRAARSQYEEILRIEPANDAARRELAIVAAATGQEADWNQAMELLRGADDRGTGGSVTDDRLQAMLLSRKGRTRLERLSNCGAAKSILQRLIASSAEGSNDVDRLLLAQIEEQRAALSGTLQPLQDARNELRRVAQRGTPTAEKLSILIEFLLRHAQAANSRGNNSAEDPERTAWHASVLAEARGVIDELGQLPAGSQPGLDALHAVFTARWLQLSGQSAAAREHIAEFVAQQEESASESANKAQRYLTFGRLYESIGEHSAAEIWYRELMEATPTAHSPLVQSLLAQGKRREAAELCLGISPDQPNPAVATQLAGLMTVTDEPFDELPAARQAIQRAVTEFPNNVPLRQAEAVMLASRGDYDAAIAKFRQIIEFDPKNALAMNNLATLLAEQPNQRGEALTYIDRAIEIAGRQSSLLDTQGTVLLKLGKATEAITALEEATAGGATDARYYLHLAAAYQMAQRPEDAQRMLQEARGRGLERFVLTGDDRRLLEALDKELRSASIDGDQPQ